MHILHFLGLKTKVLSLVDAMQSNLAIDHHVDGEKLQNIALLVACFAAHQSHAPLWF